MDVLIKGIEMPTDDVLRLEIYPDGQVRRIVGWAISEKRDAQAVALPEHGRLIDADRLKADNPQHMDADVPYVTEVTVAEIIDEAPTIVEASNGTNN